MSQRCFCGKCGKTTLVYKLDGDVLPFPVACTTEILKLRMLVAAKCRANYAQVRFTTCLPRTGHAGPALPTLLTDTDRIPAEVSLVLLPTKAEAPGDKAPGDAS